jgi:hypothetical protein
MTTIGTSAGLEVLIAVAYEEFQFLGYNAL